MKLRILGTGEAFDAGLGNNACLLSGRRIPTMLFDCGYQIPERLWAEELHSELDAVYFTHLHADHSFGIIPLLSRFEEEGRLAPLRIIGPRGTRAFVKKVFDLVYPGLSRRISFPLRWTELGPGDSARVENLRLRTARSLHSVLNLSVRVESVELPGSFAISGDGALSPQTARLYRGVGLLLHECYSLRASTPVHSSFDLLAHALPKLGIGRVGLTHLARDEKAEIAALLKRNQASFRDWFIPRPGSLLSLSNN